jgi:arylformamidase
MTHWIDVSIRLRHGLLPWPGDAPFELKRVSDLARGDACTFSTLSMSAHAGTHVDAPLHFIKGGRSVDALPLDATIGPARVILIRNPRAITTEEIRSHGIRAGERLLFKTRNSAQRQPGVFFDNYVGIAPDAADYLAGRRVRAIGIDGPSIAPPGRHMAQVHRVLLRAGIWIIEWLDLRRVSAGRCHFVCLPLRIVDGDGAPARAILRQSKSHTRRTTQTRRAP